MGKTRKPFIDKGSSKTFQLVHRSHHDPKYYDEESSPMVFKEVSTGGKDKGKEPVGRKKNAEPGSAALYGIYLDDTEYDYTQHLKPVGQDVSAVLLEAPKSRPKGDHGGFRLAEEEKMAEPEALSMMFQGKPITNPLLVGSSKAFPMEGLQPDMDPNLREVLEALEDEEDGVGGVNADGDLEDDFVQLMNAEMDEEDLGYDDTEEEEEEEEGEDEEGDGEKGEESWEAAFRRFQISRQRAKAIHNSDDEDDGRSMGTGFSMSSSAMFRNDKLTLLDQQFERIEEEYEEEDEEDEEEGENGDEGDELEIGLESNRADFEEILDEFLEKYEIVGKRMRPILPGNSEEKLDTIRRAMGEALRPVDEMEEAHGSKKELQMKEECPKETWDCQSIISTYSNLDNHPALIKEKPSTRIRLGKGGLPRVVETSITEEDGEEDEGKGDELRVNKGEARSKKESAEEKRLRKAAIKEERRNRRVNKKENQLATKEAERMGQPVGGKSKGMRGGKAGNGGASLHVFALQ